MTQFSPSKYTILVVEDHQFSRKALLNMLVRAGFENILCAKDGLEAIEKLNLHSIDLVITDINMPMVNGLELIKQIREGLTQTTKLTSIIAVTTLSDTATIAACMTLEVDAFLVKPITVQNTKVQIKNAILEPKQLYQEHLYRKVDTEVHLPSQETPVESNAPRIKEVSSHVEQITKLSELRENMIIIDSIRAKTGGCLLEAGTKINEKLLRRLYELSGVIEICPMSVRIDETQIVC